MFSITSNAYANTGDGPAVLSRRGVPLQDMEFFQFHPTGIKGMGILITEGVRGEGGILRNRSGERFMERYSSNLLDLAPRDIVSRAIVSEIREGRGVLGNGTVDDYVHLDATHLGDQTIKAKLPDIRDFCLTYLGLDPARSMIPVLPTAHYAMGGIPTDLDGRVISGTNSGTVYEGLYAAGECACVSVHGANRLGTNSLVDLVVFGRRAGNHMGDFVAGADLPAISREQDRARETIDRILSGSGEHSGIITRELRSLMQEKVSSYRDGPGLQEAEAALTRLRERYSRVSIQDRSKRFNTDLLNAIELGNLLDLAGITTASAYRRTESRGSHFREDHPERDDDRWLTHTLAWMENGTVRFGERPVDIERWKPKPRAY
jgi:succinate dehydrogenase / fumarate reductase flavoprotein subunit